MKKALITGANGFVGAALCHALVSEGIEVIAVLRDEKADKKDLNQLQGVSLVYCDLTQIKQLESLVQDRDIDVMYHLAWNGTSGALRGDYAVQISNITHTCEAVEVCKALGCNKFVFASSIMEYEIASLMEKTMAPGINTLYSSAKLSADYFARTIANSLGVEYVRAVISNIYGPGESSPRLINSSLKKLLHGEHCSFSSGEQLYDFIYISDAARAFVALGYHGRTNVTYYIGSSRPRPLKEFLIEMKDQVDPTIVIGLGEIRNAGVSLTYEEFDLDALRKETGFLPEVSFEEGIRKTIAWMKGDETG